MGKFLRLILGIGAKAAPFVELAAPFVNAAAPGLGTILSNAFNAVVRAEAKFGDGPGDQKLEYAMDLVGFSALAVIQEIKRQTGKELIDEVRFNKSLRAMVEAALDILKCFGVIETKNSPPQIEAA